MDHLEKKRKMATKSDEKISFSKSGNLTKTSKLDANESISVE